MWQLNTKMNLMLFIVVCLIEFMNKCIFSFRLGFSLSGFSVDGFHFILFVKFSPAIKSVFGYIKSMHHHWKYFACSMREREREREGGERVGEREREKSNVKYVWDSCIIILASRCTYTQWYAHFFSPANHMITCIHIFSAMLCGNYKSSFNILFFLSTLSMCVKHSRKISNKKTITSD